MSAWKYTVNLLLISLLISELVDEQMGFSPLRTIFIPIFFKYGSCTHSYIWQWNIPELLF